MLPHPPIALALLLGLCAGAAAAPRAAHDDGLSGDASSARGEPERPPNIILILADDLGWGELGCYGQARIRTPNIDRLASEGMRFTQHYSGSPVCAPSRCVLLTGKHTGHAIVRDNWERGGWGPDEPEGQYPLPEGTTTLAGLLGAEGYVSGAFGKWGLGGPGTSGAPLRQGFDRFLGHLCQRVAHNYYPTHLWSDAEKLPLPGNETWFSAHQRLTEPLQDEELYWQRFTRPSYAPDVMLEGALEFVRDHYEQPFFLYYASPIPHVALQVPPEDLGAYPEEWDSAPYLGTKAYLPHPHPRRAYAAMVSHLDREVGELLELVDELGITEETIVLFTSDNGPTFNGGSDSEFFDSAPGMRGLKCSVYEGGIRVPLVVRWPGRVASGSKSAHLSAFEDHLPTLLELVGARRPGGGDGVSFAPTLLGLGEQPQRDYLYWEYAGRQALRFGDWKAVRPRVGRGDLTLELYDLSRDPMESADVSGDFEAVAARAEALMSEARTPSEAFPIPILDAP